MKKLILMLALFSAVIGANAQTAIEKSNFLDNVGLGVTVGETTPLDLNSMFPVNTNLGVVVTKGITPVLSGQLEATTSLGDNHFADAKTAFRSMNIGLNAAFNVPNIFLGYNGTPRHFETSAIVGLGVRHGFDNSGNDLFAKTGFDFAFNIGKKRAHSIVVTPAIYWGLRNGEEIQFNHNNALISLMASYIYHFKNTNGTHSFKAYDIGAIESEVTFLQGKLAQCEADLEKCMNRKPQVIEKVKIVEKDKPVKVNTISQTEWVIQFEQGKALLTKEATDVLDTIGDNLTVNVVGTSSPEGDTEANQALSEKRAAVVADYLTNRGLKVKSSVGKGVQIGAATNRLAIVTVAQ